MALNVQAVRMSKRIDLSRVDKDDRAYVRDIMMAVVTFEHPMPELTVDIYPTPDHYNVSIKGWGQEIDDKKWHDTFLARNRDPKLDPVISTSTIPRPDEGTEPIKLLRVRRSTFSKQKRLK